MKSGSIAKRVHSRSVLGCLSKVLLTSSNSVAVCRIPEKQSFWKWSLRGKYKPRVRPTLKSIQPHFSVGIAP